MESYDAESENVRGILYMTGIRGRFPDLGQAVKWFRLAANHRSPQAMFTLAWMTVQEINKKKANKSSRSSSMYQSALRSLHAASMEGHEESSRTISLMYGRGLGVLPDRKKSSLWARVAQEQSRVGRRSDTLLWRLGGRFM